MYFLVYTTLRMLNDKDIRIAQLILNPTIFTNYLRLNPSLLELFSVIKILRIVTFVFFEDFHTILHHLEKHFYEIICSK